MPHREVAATDPLMLIFTSGTSGNPKAVPFAHVMAVLSGSSLVLQHDVTPNDVCYLSMPLFHSNGVAGGWSVAVCSGATMVPAKFSASRFLDDIRRYGATYMNYVGKPLALVLGTHERPDDADNTLRVAFGNEAADRDIAEFARRFGCRVMDGFGSSEFAVIVVREDGTPPGSIGKGWDGVAVYHADSLTECATAEFDETGALANFDDAVGELVNTIGRRCVRRLLQRSRRDQRADAPRDVLVRRPRLPRRRRLDLPRRSHQRLDARRRREPRGRTDRAHPAAMRTGSTRSRCTRCPTPGWAIRSWRHSSSTTGSRSRRPSLTDFLAGQADLSPKAWPRYVRINRRAPADRDQQDPQAHADRRWSIGWRRCPLGTPRPRYHLRAHAVRSLDVTTAVAPAGAILERQRAAFAEDGIPDLATRLDRVSRLQSMILDNTEALVSALAEDFGTRAREVSVLADVVGCMGDLEYQRKHLRSWMRTRSRGWLLTRSGLRQHDPARSARRGRRDGPVELPGATHHASGWHRPRSREPGDGPTLGDHGSHDGPAGRPCRAVLPRRGTGRPHRRTG